MTSSALRFRRADKTELEELLRHSRAQTLKIFALYEQAIGSTGFSVPQVDILNAPLWELGHLGWFQERWLLRNEELHKGMQCPSEPRLLPSLLRDADGFFDSSNVAHPTRWQLPLPQLAQLQTYLNDVLAGSIARLKQGGQSPSDLYLYWLCIAHEDMHFEAYCYMANTLGFAPPTLLRELGLWSEPRNGIVREEMQASPFYFDNENAAEQAKPSPCNDLDAEPVSWAQFSAFYETAAYDNKAYWSQQGWRWKQDAQSQQAPFTSVKPCALVVGDSNSAAVHINYWQAQAWCNANNRALPTEEQWLTAIGEGHLQWGTVWEWTQSDFEPLFSPEAKNEPFQTHPYRDYSLPWFGGRFKVLKGGSIYTHNRMKHPLYRNFYTPTRSDIFCGFRSCRLG